MASQMQIRTYKPEDKDQVIKVIKAGYETVGLAINLFGKDADLNDIQGHYAPPDSAFFVMEMDGDTIVGTSAIKKTGDGVCELGRQYVRPPFHHRGIGTSMLDEAVRFAKKQGYKSVELYIAPEMTQARELYEHYGFKFQGERQTPTWGKEFGFTLQL